MINDLTTGSVPQKLVRFSLPFMLANLLQFMYNIVDMIIVGQFVGSIGLSAVSIGAEFLHLLTFIAAGFSQAGQVMIAQNIGKGDGQKLLSRIIGNMFSIILGISIVVTILSLAGLHGFVRLMNTPAESVSETIRYCAVCGCGMFFVYGYNIISNIMQGMGDSKHPLIFVAIAAVMNLVLDIVFVPVMHLGALGAALATVMGQTFSFIVSIIFLYRNKEAFGFDFRLPNYKPSRQIVLSLLKLGIPMTLQNTAISISVMYVTSCINVYGVVFSAVNGVASKLSQLTNIMTASLRASGSTMIGQNFGARKHHRVSAVFWYVLLIGFGFASLLTALLLLFPEQTFRLFDNDAEVIAVGLTVIPVIIINFYGSVFRTPVGALVSGIGFAGMNFIMGIMDGVVVRIGLAVLLGDVLGLGVYGYWYGSAIAGFMFFVIGFPYFLSGKWKKRNLVI